MGGWPKWAILRFRNFQVEAVTKTALDRCALQPPGHPPDDRLVVSIRAAPREGAVPHGSGTTTSVIEAWRGRYPDRAVAGPGRQTGSDIGSGLLAGVFHRYPGGGRVRAGSDRAAAPPTRG